MSASMTRRAALGAVCSVAFLAGSGSPWAQSLPKIVVTKDPTCGCCGGWVDHLRASGFSAEVIESSELNRLKVRLGVPQDLASCHTAEIGGYVIEGHVPGNAIRRLLSERPPAKGLAVPGMPVGSPGMEVAGTEPETYDVILFGPSGQRTFARFRGAVET
jgi:hypothetical protein